MNLPCPIVHHRQDELADVKMDFPKNLAPRSAPLRSLFPDPDQRLAQLLADSNLRSRWMNHVNQLVQESSFEGLRDALHAARAFEEDLRQMLSTASAATSLLNDSFTDAANGKKFSSLPDDVIAIILEMACRYINPRFGIRLMQVSRRFRRILSSLPNVWSTIGWSYPLREARALAEMSSPSAMSVFIQGATYADDKEVARSTGMYQLAISISSRIQSLALHFTRHDSNRPIEILSSASFPVLTELELLASPHVGRDTRALYRDWDTPSLRKLTIVDFIPELRPETASQIETLSIEVNRVDFEEEEEENVDVWTTTEIVTFIRSLSSLKDLHVEVRLFDDYTGTADVPMPSVEHLSLVLQDLETATHLNILNLIRFPAIRTFKLNLGLPGLECLSMALNSNLASFGHPGPTSVNDLTLSLSRQAAATEVHLPIDYRSPSQVVYGWCEAFGGLKSLTLESHRDGELGLFSFAQTMDQLQLVSSDGSSLPLHNALRDITWRWDNQLFGVKKRAILKVTPDDVSPEAIQTVRNLKEMSKIIDIPLLPF